MAGFFSMLNLVYTTIFPHVKRKLLLRGTILGCCGALLLCISSWDVLTFFVSLVLISFGMIPLRRIERIERMPHTLCMDGGDLVYTKPGKLPIRIRCENLSYEESGDRYGIRCGKFFFPYFSERSFRMLSEII